MKFKLKIIQNKNLKINTDFLNGQDEIAVQQAHTASDKSEPQKPKSEPWDYSRQPEFSALTQIMPAAHLILQRQPEDPLTLGRAFNKLHQKGTKWLCNDYSRIIVKLVHAIICSSTFIISCAENQI